MGKLSLLVVIAALLLSGVVLYNSKSTAQDAELKLTVYQHQVMAREAALTGLDMAAKNLSTFPWVVGNFALNNVSYKGGTYTVTASLNQCATSLSNSARTYWTNLLSITTPGTRLLELTSTGQSDSLRHQVIACYAWSNFSAGTPPAYQYAFLSGQTFTFNGGPDVVTYDITGNSNIHSNTNMTLGPQVSVDGYATYVTSAGSSVHRNSQVLGFSQGQTIPVPQFNPEEYRARANLIDPGYDQTGGTVIKGSSAYNAANPYYWFVDGNLTISGNSKLILPGYTVVIVTGNISVSGSASITTNGTAPASRDTSVVRDWITTQLAPDGTNKISFFVNGTGSLSGTGQVVGSFYSNSSFTLNGGGQGSNIVGGIIARTTITANGGGNGGNFWYTGTNQAVIIPGVTLPGQDVITRLTTSEWSHQLIQYN